MNSPAELARHIQHTRIETGLTREQMIAHCEECVTYGFDAAMVAGSWVPLAVDVLKGTGITVASALDFPTVGAMTTAGKAAEAAELVRLGAEQIDIGVQVGWLRSGRFDDFRDDIAAVVKAAGVPIKVMLELPLLTPAEREAAVALSVEAGVAYVKNASSGAVGVATPEDIRFLKERVPAGVKVKASGGIKSYAQAVALLEAGADRLGTSAGVSIVSGEQVAPAVAY
ncbi:deoxyribose-phosphate aldolase [Streptosporangium becharense]|uniref:Deoxyribose-phosphate aldolase n=1 Tax=Streptosporangium becharense TaxID=1816182 RepID=A0A7W9IB07_9ACTN|nr:deoxyribose-phosphate aldolase [Streptosporangium becharense]MBB2910737.1 deoxyribose-phosphate aldolase [Streptosporangium becharense]MBB5817432.1 deoxyribose-phosphate aldolase [Streptosporangium becharense]